MDLATLEPAPIEESIVERVLAAVLPGQPGHPTPSVADVDAVLRDAGRSRWRHGRPAWTEFGWWETPMLPEVRALLRLPKGPALMTAVQQLPAPDGSACTFPHTAKPLTSGPEAIDSGPCTCQVVLVAAWATAAAWAADRADSAVLRTLGPTEQTEYLNPHLPELGTISDRSVELVAPALRRTPASLRHHLARVRTRNQFPNSLRAAIADGFVPTWQADLIVQDLTGLEPAGRDLVLDTVVDTLRSRHRRGSVGWTFRDVRRRTRQVMAGLGDELRRRRNDVQRDRGVSVRHGEDGWSRITADLPTDVADRIHNRLTAMARALDDDEGRDPSHSSSKRTVDQIRTDVFTDLLLGSPHEFTSMYTGEVAVVIALSTLLRADDQPGDLRGCGPIPAEVARGLAADSRWRAWITDATGTVVATSASTYSPTAAVARVVRAREPHCRMPGCQRTVTDLDHVIP